MTNIRPGGPTVLALLLVALLGSACGQNVPVEDALANNSPVEDRPRSTNLEIVAEDGSTTTTALVVQPAEAPTESSPTSTGSSAAPSSTTSNATANSATANSATTNSATANGDGPQDARSETTGFETPATSQPSPAAATTAAATNDSSPPTTAAPASDSSITAEIVRTPGCVTDGDTPKAEGLKQWCWADLAQEIGQTEAQNSFSNGQLAKSIHYNADGVYVRDGRLHFSLNPTSPANGSTHYRQEIRENPANSKHPLGTEQWWGFDYRFGDDYVADELPWILWQTHGYFSAPVFPMTALEVAPSNYQSNGNPPGELFVSNTAISSDNSKKTRLGIVPRAGQTLSIVIQMVWGDNSTGLFRVWIDGALVYDERERTAYVEQPEAGYWKLGIYKWRWKDQSNVDSSSSRGIDELNTSIGQLRVIKRSPSNPSYLNNEYNTVKPS